MSEITKEDVRDAVGAVMVLAEVVREVGEIPSGHLYAQVLGHMPHEVYAGAIRVLVRAKLVEEKNHVLRWVGPAVGSST